MPEKFSLISRIRTYQSKADKTNSSRFTLVKDSQNVLIDDQGKVKVRGGYSLFGSSDTTSNPEEAGYDWRTNSDEVIHLRAHDEYLQFYAGTVDGVEFNDWYNLSSGFSAVDFCFAPWWDTTEKVDGLIIANGNDYLWSWSGAMASMASATANTITKNGTNTWAQNRFLLGSGKLGATTKLISATTGTVYTYTGGEDTTTLTGVTPNPSGEAADTLFFQAITLHDNEPADGTKNDIIWVEDNQLYVGSNSSREVYVSKNTDFKDFTYSSPRAAGEGNLFTLDAVCRAIKSVGGNVAISAGDDYWYKVVFNEIDIGGTLYETMSLERMKTGSGMAAKSQDLTEIVGDYLAFVNFNNELMLIGDIENVENPRLTPLSDPVKPDFDDADFTGGQVKSNKNRIYISAPNDDNVWITETRLNSEGNLERFWHPPQILPVSKFMVRSGEIYGHSNRVQETYKLFDGTNDNGFSFTAREAFAYRSFGRRDALKVFTQYLTEGYISPNTDLKLTLNYDFGGYTQQLERIIEGDDDDILFQSTESGSIGDNPIGDTPIGDQLEQEDQHPKFRIIHTIPPQDFFEVQAIYETDSIDAYWEILSQGPDVRLSITKPISIKKST